MPAVGAVEVRREVRIGWAVGENVEEEQESLVFLWLPGVPCFFPYSPITLWFEFSILSCKMGLTPLNLGAGFLSFLPHLLPRQLRA